MSAALKKGTCGWGGVRYRLVVEGDFSVQLKSKSSWVGAVCQGNDIMIKIFHTREELISQEKLCKKYIYIICYVRHNRGTGR